MTLSCRTIIPNKFSHTVKESLRTHRFPILGIWQGTKNAPREFDWRPVDLIAETCRTEETDLEAQTTLGALDPDKGAVTHTKRLTQTCLWCQVSLVEAWVDRGLLQGQEC